MTMEKPAPISDEIIMHTIVFPESSSKGSEFEISKLYGLSRSEYKSIRPKGLLEMPIIFNAIILLVGLFLPDAYQSYKSKAFEFSEWSERITFIFIVMGIVVSVEIIRKIACHCYPVSERCSDVKRIDSHFKSNQPKRARSN